MSHDNPRRVGNRWVFPDGASVPVVSGGDHSSAPTTLQALRDKRAQYLNDIDVILNTAKDAKRDLTDQERVDHDAIVALIEGPDGLDAQIAAAVTAEADAGRFAAQEGRRKPILAPNINVRGGSSVGADVTRNLDALLWATAEEVRAGSFDRAGNLRHSGAINPVEQVVIRSEGGDIELAPRLSEFRPEDRGVIRDFQKTVADMALFGLLVDKSAKTSADGFAAAREHRKFKATWGRILNALDVDTSGEGTEWVPTGIGASMHEKVRAAGKIAPLFARVNMPTNPWKWPVEGADATAFRVAEPTADNASKVAASTPGTVAPTFDAEIFGARTLWSRSLDADSALAILPFAQRKLVIAFMNAEEKAILDGDTDGTHQDTDVQALGATDARTAWDGLRKRALAQTPITNQTTTTAANLALIRAAMLKWGVNPADLAYIIGLSAYYDLLADTALLTVDKMGPNAPILNGQLGSVHGIPVIVSEFVREDLNATGVNDGITATKTYNMCVNRNEFAIGQRSGLDIEVDDSIYRESYQRVIVGFQREDFQSIAEAATDDTCALAYNITP